MIIRQLSSILKPLKTSLIILVSVLTLVTLAKAGSLTPGATPTATSYTLSDIYTRLSTNATATVGNHNLNPTFAPAATFYTLTQIYDAIPTIDATKVLSGISYLGIAGSITNVGAQTITSTTSNTVITTGYHNGSGYCAGDVDLITANIKTGANIFGIDGDVNVVN